MNASQVLRLTGVFLVGLLAFGVWLGLGRVAGPPTPGSVPVLGASRTGERRVFDLADPAGDDRGPGTYRYPADPTFAPGTFDLRRFLVTADEESVHFRLTFGALPNPWGAPEGFGYQRVDIYMDTTPGGGSLVTARPGANVQFDPRHGWEFLVRCAPWRGSRLERPAPPPGSTGSGGNGGNGEPVRLSARAEDGNVVHVTVPRSALGSPSRRWRYYVLVGGYDAFGPDEFRPVTEKGGRWVFGGGRDSNADPNVLDLLAPRFALNSQLRQLRDAPGGGAPLVSPVGGR